MSHGFHSSFIKDLVVNVLGRRRHVLQLLHRQLVAEQVSLKTNPEKTVRYKW